MSIKLPSNTQESQSQRLKIKTLGEQMKRIATQGAGLSPWESDVLLEAIDEVYFSDPELQHLQTGQMRYTCVAATEGPGKALTECAMQTVNLTLLAEEDRQELPLDGKQGSVERRRRKLMRLTEEAREQGGLLTQEDLSEILGSDVRTIRRDIIDLRKQGITVATRGQQKDIGPGVSHRGLAIRHWLEGKEVVAVARCINHSIKAVENYLEKFKRVAYLRRKGFDDYQIALTIGISLSAVKTFVGIYHEFKGCSFFKNRMAEIEFVGEQSYLSCDEKKELDLSNATWIEGKSS